MKLRKHSPKDFALGAVASICGLAVGMLGASHLPNRQQLLILYGVGWLAFVCVLYFLFIHGTKRAVTSPISST